ncbi:MAG: hypothetical protein ABR927_02550 [Bacteroidales bacterium]
MMTRIKICCIKSEYEARTAIESGASAIGLVARMPSGHGPIFALFRIFHSMIVHGKKYFALISLKFLSCKIFNCQAR